MNTRLFSWPTLLLLHLLLLMLPTGIQTEANASEAPAEPLAAERLLEDAGLRQRPDAVVTQVQGRDLLPPGVDSYRSLTLSAPTPADIARIESLVTQDGRRAFDHEASYRGGKLYYAFYSFPGRERSAGPSRYLLYLNQAARGDGSGGKVVLILLRGRLSTEQARALLKAKPQKKKAPAQ